MDDDFAFKRCHSRTVQLDSVKLGKAGSKGPSHAVDGRSVAQAADVRPRAVVVASDEVKRLD